MLILLLCDLPLYDPQFPWLGHYVADINLMPLALLMAWGTCPQEIWNNARVQASGPITMTSALPMAITSLSGRTGSLSKRIMSMGPGWKRW